MPKAKKSVRSQVEKITNKKNISKLNIILLQYFKLILFGVVLLFFVVCYIYLLNPKYGRIKNNIAESFETKQVEFEKLENYLSNLTGYLSEYRKVAEIDKDRIDIMVPNSGSYKEFYYFFETLARNHNIFLSSIDIKATEKAELKTIIGSDKPESGGVLADLGKININLDVVGVNYVGFKKLLTALENSLRILDVTNVEFIAGTKEARLSIVSYYYSLDNETDSVE